MFKSKKEIEEKNNILEKHLEQEVKALHTKLDKIKHFSENVEKNLEKKIVIENDKVISKIDSIGKAANQNQLNKNSAEENIEIKARNKPKLSKSKLKELKEEKIMEAFEKDCKVMYE